MSKESFREAAFEDFKGSFPFPPDALVVIRSISTRLTGMRSTIGSSEQLRELAKLFKAVLGKKRAKTVSLKTFNPKIDLILDRGELARLVKEFEGFVNEQWEDGKYLKIQ